MGVLESGSPVRQHGFHVDTQANFRATRRPLGRSYAAIIAAGLLAVAACSPSNDSPQQAATTTGCEAAVEQASLAVEVEAQIRLLDRALLACRSYDALTGQLVRYPGIIGYDAPTFISLRCARVDDADIRTSPSCATVIAPATTVPPATIPEIVFVGDTLDGRPIEIRPSATTRFAGEVPAVVQQTVDIAFESGCDGVIAQRDLWESQVNNPVGGDEASVYAQHAQNVANYIGCEDPPLDQTIDNLADG
ncbi:MAG: hypothetical protein ACI9OJ_005748 [Myxococcota bacterium]|jgi:hypothetical protein